MAEYVEMGKEYTRRMRVRESTSQIYVFKEKRTTCYSCDLLMGVAFLKCFLFRFDASLIRLPIALLSLSF